jgi:septation ring formation regulator EzrA
MVTAQRYNEDYHDPYAKYEGDPNSYLKNTDLFVNLTAKISVDDKSQFITLATFPNQETLIKEGLKYVKGDVTDLKNKINNFYEKLDHDLPLDFTGFKKINTVNLDNFQAITGTRLVTKDSKNKSTYTLDTLKEKIPGIKHSIIKMFPGNLNDFKTYVNKYSFGEKRSEERIAKLFDIFKNKPHIVISFDSDLNGSNDNTQAKLMPIGSKSRTLNELIDEVLTLKKDASDEVKHFYENNEKGTYVPSKELNARFEVILNPSQILDMLIK